MQDCVSQVARKFRSYSPASGFSFTGAQKSRCAISSQSCI